MRWSGAPRKSEEPALPQASAIDPAPLNDILAMRGTVTGGVYKAAIGRKALLHGEAIGRELGMTTWVSFAGTNNRAVVQGEFLATSDELQNVLKALRLKGGNVLSIRNHTFGEHPQVVFVRFWEQGPASDLARALRFVLDVQVGAIALKPGAR